MYWSRLPLRDLVQRRLRDVDVAGLDQVLHLAEQQRQDERADVGAVDVGVRHQDDLVVPELRDVELVADAGAERRDHRLDLGVLQHLVDPGLLDIEDLAAQREDGLRGAVAPLLGRAAGGVTLDDEQLGDLRFLDHAVGELAREAHAAHGRLARGVAGLAGRGAGAGGVDGLADDPVGLLRVLLEELRELGVDHGGDEALHARVAELGLRLALELRVGQLGADDRRQALADVLALERLVLVLEQAGAARVAVQRAGQRGAEAREVRAALVRVDVVREREHRLLVGAVPLQRDLDGAVLVVLALEVDDLARRGPCSR